MAAELNRRNLTDQSLPPGTNARLARLLKQVTGLTRRPLVEINVVFVTPQAMRQLNRAYRHHDRVTDVLSFAYQSRPVIGDLIICLRQARAQAKRYRRPLARELDLLFVHGLLHLCGWDHQQPKERLAMRALERRALTSKVS